MIRRYIPKSIDELADWYMRYISPLALIAGFILDNLVLLRRVDVWTSNALLFFYLVVAALCIVFFNLIESGRLRHKFFLKILPLLPVAAQFAFGGLFSGYLSLYSRSAAYAVSWIFVVIIALVLLGNERFYKWYRHFPVQIGVYFCVLFSFFIFFLPVVFLKIGPYMFIGSGVVSLAAISLFVFLLEKLVPEVAKRARVTVIRSILIIFVIFNLLYFSNAIPPLPLALKDAGVYHGITRSGNSYELQFEPVPWYESYLRYNNIFHRAPGEPVHVWTAVFAPSGLSTTILHEWQRYDEAIGAWVTLSTLAFPINGGRDGGYRGYTTKYDVSAGKWRVNVITRYGQIVGRVSFTVVAVDTKVGLATAQQ